MPFTVIFSRAARVPARRNRYGPLSWKGRRPMAWINFYYTFIVLPTICAKFGAVCRYTHVMQLRISWMTYFYACTVRLHLFYLWKPPRCI